MRGDRRLHLPVIPHPSIHPINFKITPFRPRTFQIMKIHSGDQVP
jgi:hypothetical protein